MEDRAGSSLVQREQPPPVASSPRQGHRRIFGELTKYVEYTRERDIWISWEWRNWLLPTQEFVQKIWNTTGEPDDISAQVSFADFGGRIHDLNPSCERASGEKYAWEIRWPIDPDWIGKLARVRLGYRFRAGGVLTAEEMTHVRSGDLAEANPGHLVGVNPRRDGQEYETVWTSEAVAAASLIVVLQPEYAPDGPPIIRVEKEIEVPGLRPDDPPGKVMKRFPDQVSELQQYLSFPTKGLFSLRVPYPYPNCDYTLAWHPVSEATVSAPMANDLPQKRFRKVAREKGSNLLEAFSNTLAGQNLLDNATLALYVRENSSQGLTLQRTAWKALGPENGHVEPPVRIPFKGERQASTLAWWGQPQIMARPDDPTDASEAGFVHPSEQAICGVPIRFNLESMTNPPTWGLVRIAVLKGNGHNLQGSNVIVILQTRLLAATTALLSVALQEGF